MPDPDVLRGKVAIVTGAARGIGKAEAKVLASAGAELVTCDVDFDGLVAGQQEIAAAGGNCVPVRCDVREKSQIDDVVTAALDTHGPVDILINNAQTGLEPVPWQELTDEAVINSLHSGPLASFRFNSCRDASPT